ncbi:MAG: ATPase domain-containing protein [Candidatus Bathyarchaeia archaeon]
MQKCSKDRVSTGDQNLDRLMEGGFPKGSLILLAGNPGVGKTVFGANFICKGVKDFDETGVYVSLAEDRETFYSNISKHFGTNCEECGKRGMCIFLDYATVKEEGISAMLESILEEIMKVNAKRLVIDSFTAMAQAFKEQFESRIILHTILGKIVRKMGCTTLLICEVPYGANMISKGMEEFVADGVIVLRTSSLEERLFRDLEIKKMRGTFIKEREISFTLKMGFRVIQPFKFELIEKPSRCKLIPHSPVKFTTASSDLNCLLEGGFKRGTVSLLEIGDNVSFEQYLFSVLAPIQWNFINNGQPIISIPSPGIDHKIILANIMQGGFTEEELSSLYRFIEPKYSEWNSQSLCSVNIKGKSIEEDFEIIVDETLKMMNRTGKPPLLVLSANTFIYYYGISNAIKALSVLSTIIKEHNSLMLVFLKPGFERVGRMLGAMADTHLKIIREHGAIFLYGVKPRTPLHAVELDVSEGYPIPKLTPVV